MRRTLPEIASLLPTETAQLLHHTRANNASATERVLKRLGMSIEYLEDKGIVLAPPEFEAVMHIMAIHLLHEASVGAAMVRHVLRQQEVSGDGSPDDGA